MTTNVVYPTDGTNATFGVPFLYLDKAHVHVFLNGTETTAFTWPTSGTIQLNSVPAAGSKVGIYRATPGAALTEYQAGSTVTTEDLETDSLQALYLIEELGNNTIGGTYDETGTFVWDARGNRIANVGDPLLEQDAINLRYFLQSIGDLVSLGLNTAPQYWDLDGETDGTTAEFYLPGATATAPEFYDVVVNGVPMEPYDDFTIFISPDPNGSKVVLNTAPADGVNAWVVCRGYAKPVGFDLLDNEAFQQLLRDLITGTLYESNTVLNLGALRYLLPLYDVAGTAETVDGTKESYLLRTTNASPVDLTIRANTGGAGDSLDFETNPVAAPFFSVKQHGAGQVSILGAAGVTVTPPDGYLAKTRARGAVVTATCDYAAGGQWMLSGDLAVDPDYVDGQATVRYNKTLAAAFSSSTTTKADVTGWAFPVAAGKTYRIQVRATYQTAATTTGGTIGLAATGGAAGTVNGRATGAVASGASSAALATTLSSLSSSLTTTGVSATNTPHWIEMELVFVCSTSGTVSIQWASEVAASAAQLNAGSALFVEEVVLS